MRRLFMLLLLLLGSLPVGAATAAPDDRCFAETGFCIGGAIRAYWEGNGGLPVFGYPITAQRTETVEGAWTGPVQWFERDRLEDHSNEGKGILAGRLGAHLLELQGRPWTRGAGAGSTTNCTAFPETGYRACGIFRKYWLRNGGLARGVGIAKENSPVAKFLYPKFGGTAAPYDSTPLLTSVDA